MALIGEFEKHLRADSTRALELQCLPCAVGQLRVDKADANLVFIAGRYEPGIDEPLSRRIRQNCDSAARKRCARTSRDLAVDGLSSTGSLAFDGTDRLSVLAQSRDSGSSALQARGKAFGPGSSRIRSSTVGERVATGIFISQRYSVLVKKRIGKVCRMEPSAEFGLPWKSRSPLALIPAHLKFVEPEIALVGIEIPPEAMTIHILRENVALKNGALQRQPFPRI